MTPKIAKDSWLALLFVALMSANINASARELNNDVNEQLESKAAKLIAQKKLTELAYKRLLEISEKNAQIKKLKDAANKAKPQLIKASYNSVSNNSIKGLKGEYLVLDKMNKRWRKKIDIYMGMNKKKAFRWGKRNVEIFWNS